MHRSAAPICTFALFTPMIRHLVYECLPGAYAGGVQKMVFELASAQRRLGADVEVWTVDAARAGKTVTLADEKAMSRLTSPFRRVDLLAEYVVEIVGR